MHLKLPGVLMHWWAQGCGSRSHSFMSGLSTKKDQHQEKTRGQSDRKEGRKREKGAKIMQKKQLMDEENK